MSFIKKIKELAQKAFASGEKSPELLKDYEAVITTANEAEASEIAKEAELAKLKTDNTQLLEAYRQAVIGTKFTPTDKGAKGGVRTLQEILKEKYPEKK